MSNDKFDTARQVLRQQKLTGERALFQSENLAVYDSAVSYTHLTLPTILRV